MRANVEETWNRIDVILENCLDAIQDQGRSIEDCLDVYPEQRTELESLLRLAVQLQAGRNMKTTPRFKAATLARLRNLAATRSLQRRSSSSLSAPRLHSKPTFSLSQSHLRFSLLWIAVLVAVLIAAFAATIAASAQALPGDFLYPVKRAQERIQLTFTIHATDQAGLHLKYANRRIAEAVTMVERGQTAALEQVLADYNQRMQREYSLLIQENGLTPEQKLDLASQLLSNTSRLENSLASLSDQAPLSVQTNIQAALAATQKVQNQAQEIVRHPAIGDQPTSTMQERIPITKTPTPTIGKITPAASRITPAPGTQLVPGLIPSAASTPAPSRDIPTPGSQLDPGSTPARTPAPATSTQTRGATPGVKATPTPASLRTPSPTPPISSIATHAATQSDVRPTFTPSLLIRPSATPGRWGTSAIGAPPGASATLKVLYNFSRRSKWL